MKRVLIVLLIILLFFIFRIDIDKNDRFYVVDNHYKINYEKEITKLKKIYNNDDIVGILWLENSNFNEVVVQYSNNDYYLEHDINNDNNWMGQTFLDYRNDINSSKKLIIYGHNSNYYELPFKIFENFYDKEYLYNHKYLYLLTEQELKKYEIFSVFVEVSDWTYYTNLQLNEEEYLKHLNKLKEKSFYNIEMDLTKEDEILIIQTCSYDANYLSYEDKFLLVIGKRI